MKKLLLVSTAAFFLFVNQSIADEKNKAGVIEKLKNATCEGFFFGIKAGKDCDKLREDKTRTAKKNKDLTPNQIFKKNSLNSISSNTDLAFYTGTFDVIDKEGDDQTTLFGIEHRNSNLFRNTFLGKLAPVSGAFMTGKNSLYFYTGVEGQYNLGPMNISPSFTPGYYEKGNGKDLGSALEFKSEIKVGFNILSDSNFGYSYSHISNNDWGTTNPGTDNQQLTFSTKF